jgi:hypothetical protein
MILGGVSPCKTFPRTNPSSQRKAAAYSLREPACSTADAPARNSYLWRGRQRWKTRAHARNTRLHFAGYNPSRIKMN